MFDYLKARVGEFDELRGRLWRTENGDIAYHFIVNPNVHADFSTGNLATYYFALLYFVTNFCKCRKCVFKLTMQRLIRDDHDCALDKLIIQY